MINLSKFVATAVATSVTMALAACGGGGSGTNGSAGGSGSTGTAYAASSLVSDKSAISAAHNDPNLVNPWGLVFAPGEAVWVANNGTQTSTLYDGTGAAQGTFGVPGGTGGDPDPTGIVANSSSDFAVTTSGKTAPALFIFDGEGGTLSGWAPSVDAGSAVLAYDDGAINGASAAVYKGLAIASNGTANFLYATDFHNNKVDVFNAQFQKVTASGGFVDPTLPAGYAPFGIQAIANGVGGAAQIYVAYALQDAAKHDNQNGAGLGLVDIYDANGNLVKHLIPVGGALNAPWGITLAPSDFGPLSNTLLVGNFGDGLINAYDPATGAFVNNVHGADGTTFSSPGLWGIAFGNDAPGLDQPHNTLFYAAGTNDENDGTYGRIDLSSTPASGGGAPSPPY